MTSRSAPATSQSILSLTAYRDAINEALEKFFSEFSGVVVLDLSAKSREGLAKLHAYTMRPGKRIRGALAAATYDQRAGTHFGEAGMALAVALELVQSYLLIIDDVMDKSDMRRGEPTVHQLYAAQADEFGDEHEASMLAINIGLIGQHMANLALLTAPEKSERIVRVLRLMHKNVTATGFGQLDDLYHKVGRNLSEQDVLRMYCFKSSYYTFINPLQCGLALAGGRDPVALEQVRLFGEAAGVAFQLHDDYLGIFGEAPEMGKLNVDDLKEGKYTLLVHYALEHGSAEEAKELRALLGNSRIGKTEVARAQEIFERTGAKGYVRRATRRYADVAQEQLAAIRVWDGSFRTWLADLVEYSIGRRA